KRRRGNPTTLPQLKTTERKFPQRDWSGIRFIANAPTHATAGKTCRHQVSPFEKEFGSSLFAPVHVLRLRERLRPRPVLALQTLKKAPGGGCQFRRESLVIILASERKFSREDAALLPLRPHDQCPPPARPPPPPPPTPELH